MERRTRDGRRRWRQWTELDGRAALEELAASDESSAEFARRKGVTPQRLAYWRKRLVATPAIPAFVSLESPVAATAAAGPGIELCARGVTVRVREDLDSAKLALLVDVLIRAAASC